MNKLLIKAFTSILFFITLAFAGCAKDEVETSGTVFGIINDSENGEPVAGATVSLLPGGKSTNTGGDGSFEFGEMEPGQYTLQVKKNGYKTNSKSISVVAGQTARGDLSVMKGVTNIKLSAESLNFGSQQTTLSFKIMNIGTSGDVKWNISEMTADWLSVSPNQGSTAPGKESAVTVTVNRSKLKESASASFIINGDGESFSFIVSAAVGPDNGNEGGETGASQGVTSCDERISVKVVSCKRNVGTLSMTYMIENTGMGKDMDKFSIYGSSSSYSDNDGNSYNTGLVTLTLGATTNTGTGMVYAPLLQNTPVKGTVTIKDFNENATSVTARIYCGSTSDIQLADKWITFKSINIE